MWCPFIFSQKSYLVVLISSCNVTFEQLLTYSKICYLEYKKKTKKIHETCWKDKIISFFSSCIAWSESVWNEIIGKWNNRAQYISQSWRPSQSWMVRRGGNKRKKLRERKKKATKMEKAGKEDRRVIKEGAGYCIERQGRETLFLLEEWFLSFLFDKPMKEEYWGKNNALHHTGWGRRKRSVFFQKVVDACHPSAHPSFWDQWSAKKIETVMKN